MLRLLACASCAASTVIAQNVFTADVSGQTTPLRFPMLESVGSGHMELSLRADYRDAMKNVQRDIGFSRVRGHGLLDDDMSTFLSGHANMYNVFNSYDFFLSQGIRPIVELSFMPAALANGTDTIMHYNGITSGPKDLEAWGAFINEMVTLMVQRYGVEEVRSWAFEVWNEPNSCGFWCGGGQKGYFDLYNTTARAIKAVDPYIPVGGPATAELLWVPDMIQYARTNDVPLDFISTHLYPSDPGLPQTRNVFESQVGAAAKTAADAGLPFYLTEFDGGWSIHVSDEPYTASFLVHTALAFQNVSDPGINNVQLLSYWTFSDVFEEAGFISAPYVEEPYQKFGIQTIYGVPKPSYRALEMISSMKRLQGVPVTGTSSGGKGQEDRKGGEWQWVGAGPQATVGATSGTVDVLTALDTSGLDSTTLLLLATNFNIITATGALPCTAQQVTFVVDGIPAASVGSATATLTLLDEQHGYAKAAWKAAGSPVYPTPAQTALELAASVLVPVPVTLTQGPGAGQVSYTLTMPPYGVAMLKVTY